VRRVIALLATLLLALATAGCSDDVDAPGAQGDQRQLNSVLVGSYDELSAADSEAVSAIGLELVSLGAPLRAWFDGTEARERLLAQMTAAVDRIEGRLTPERAPEVRTTFEPYVVAWRDVLAALDVDDDDAYEKAVAHIRDLDQIRIDRVADVYGEEEAQRLLQEESGG
jgi:hypothetical protein